MTVIGRFTTQTFDPTKRLLMILYASWAKSRGAVEKVVSNRLTLKHFTIDLVSHFEDKFLVVSWDVKPSGGKKFRLVVDHVISYC